ncbi:RHS repeat-associated core domain-containing protein, partial [Citrobacter amalonaticus]|nr:RHS repeat protein [Citrobacter amalonaticus]
QLVHIRGQHEQRDYQYGDAGRLLGTHITSPHHDLAQWTFTDPAGNRTAQRDKYPMLPDHFRDNRISQDVENFYHYDEHGRLTEKDERRIHPHGSLSHHYEYDNQHRLVHYRRMQAGNVLTESRYLYDPPGRRVSKRVWACTVFHDGSCSQPALQETVWYAWDGNRLTTTQTDKTRIQTVYLPGSFTPLIRIETATGELTKAIRRTLAEKFQQEANVTFPPELVAMVDNLEAELRRGELSEASRTWLAQCGLTPEQIQNQIEPEYTPERKIHLYHCDHRGLPLALIDINGAIAWRAEIDEWGNMLREDNPHNLEQLIRLPGQQYDEETGLYYNRHRYYDPAQGRYITQDPIGLMGGWSLYLYPLNPIEYIDPLGLDTYMCTIPLHTLGGTGTRSGPDIWGNPFYHQYLCVDNGKGGYTCGGQDRTGAAVFPGSKGKATNDTWPTDGNGACKKVDDRDCVNECVKNRVENKKRPWYQIPFGIDCQDWSDDVLNSCKESCSRPYNLSMGWFNKLG